MGRGRRERKKGGEREERKEGGEREEGEEGGWGEGEGVKAGSQYDAGTCVAYER